MKHQSTERPARSGANSKSYGWSEILIMKRKYGIQIIPSGEPLTVEAELIHSIYRRWKVGREHKPVISFEELFSWLKGEYRHLTSAERAEKIPALLLAAVNDPNSGIEVARVPFFWERVPSDPPCGAGGLVSVLSQPCTVPARGPRGHNSQRNDALRPAEAEAYSTGRIVAVSDAARIKETRYSLMLPPFFHIQS